MVKKTGITGRLVFSGRKKGFQASFRARKFRLIYPDGIWESYPAGSRDFLLDNLAFLGTLSMPLVSGAKEVEYNTSPPVLGQFFRNMVIRNIPSAIEDYRPSTSKTISHFMSIRYKFRDNLMKMPFYKGKTVKNRVVIPFSCGKDSLLTLAVCRDIGLDPVCVYINDTVSPDENRLKLECIKRISRQFGLKVLVVTNELENLNDFEYWDTEESCAGYAHMITGFCFAALPVAHYFKAGWVVLGNQHNMNYSFINKDGYLAYPSYDQSAEGTMHLSGALGLATEGKVGVTSFIEPLSNIAIIKLLHRRYAAYGRHEISCDCINTTRLKRRWCCACNKCARLALMMRAVGVDPAACGINKSMLDRNSEPLYTLFKGSQRDCYEKSGEARDEQLFSFYLAYKNGTRGYLIDKFKKKFLNEARAREKYLHGKFMTIQSRDTLPAEYRRKVLSIYSSELKKK